jgi:phosphoribosyl 1,2-cyclic phosphodiesterase/FixJ family two-component response regulator
VRIQFWGTRGSIAKPGPSTTRHGGNTSCVEVRSARGTLVVIDCGTGAHPLGQKLMSAGANDLRGHILISHTHWDHIQGVPFFAPLFVPGNHWDIYGPKGLDQSLREALTGQMQYTYFPVTPDQFGATIRYHDLVEGVFDIDDIRVTAHYLNHPALTLGYRLEADGATIVYCCDHEPHSQSLADGQGDITGQDLQHCEFVQEADLLIHDAQYTAAEYPSKIGWGHSPVEYAVKIAQHAHVKKLALTHHDPLRDDHAIDCLVENIKTHLNSGSSPLQVFAAVEGEILDIEQPELKTHKNDTGQFKATTPIEPALAERSILLAIADPITATAISEVVSAEGLRFNSFSNIDEVRTLISRSRPSLAIVEHNATLTDTITICQALHQTDDELPVVLIAGREDSALGIAAGASDWLIRPFSRSFARTKIRAWVLRTACRWKRAAIPLDEETRLASLRELGILDTEAEERFNRVTRLAAALFDVPIALIGLVDRDRQWYKSCLGLTAKEAPRDVTFCAHVIYNREPMIVPDTFQDSRFADNPFVINEPRIRFYAGYPLILDNGSCIGTLCLLDARPRTIDHLELERLRDLANIALREICAFSQ